MNVAQKRQLTRVFDCYDQMTNKRKLMEEERRADRERFFDRFDGLRENTIDPELNEFAEAIKARGHHAEVCETPRSEQSPPAVHLVVSKAGEVRGESPEDQNRLTFRPDAGKGRAGGRVAILDSTKGNCGDPIEVGNVSLTALSRQDVANRAIEFAARVIEVRPTGPTAETVENAESNRSEPQPCQQLTQMITSYWVARAIYLAAKLRIADHLMDGADGRRTGHRGRRGGPAAVPGPPRPGQPRRLRPRGRRAIPAQFAGRAPP